MADVPATDRAVTTPAAPAPEARGISGLKKMSTTAGVGSGDYAAVNLLAVVSLMLALLGALVLLSSLFLFIPLLSLVFAVVALRQIYTSNGTQTGVLLAGAAIVISLGLGGYVLGGNLLADIRNRPEQEKILAVLDQFEQAIAAKDYDAAYQLTSPAFQARVSQEKFRESFAAFEGVADFRGIAEINWNGIDLHFEADPQSNNKVAWVGTLFKYRVPETTPGRVAIGFVKVGDDRWMVNEIPIIFGSAQ